VPLLAVSLHGGMHERIELGKFFFVFENHGAHKLSIVLPIGGSIGLWPENIDNSGTNIRIILDEPPRPMVSIIDGYAQGGEDFADRRFAAADTSSDTDSLFVHDTDFSWQMYYFCARFMATITFQFEDTNIPTKKVEGIFVDMSILEITEEADVHLNHNCGGVCACSTCHIYVERGEDHLEEISDKEEDFIDRAVNPRIESRLACQCIILNEGADVVVTIPDQSRIIGHEH
jgi:ferredoxin, 2Fe-2S